MSKYDEHFENQRDSGASRPGDIRCRAPSGLDEAEAEKEQKERSESFAGKAR